MTCLPSISMFGISSNLGRAARLPAAAGAGLTCQGAWVPGNSHEAGGLRESAPSLTYSEIGQGLVACVDAGIIDQEQARQIGNVLFPPEQPTWNGPP